MTRYLCDTNILLRWAVTGDPLGDVARTAVKRLAVSQATLHVSSQNILEFWSVATRPRSANGLGMKPAEVPAEIDRIEQMFPLLEETPEVYRHWRRLVETCGVSGRQVHDARLAAVMQVHGVTHILTFNTDDFQRYPGIVAVDPRAVPEPETPPEQEQE